MTETAPSPVPAASDREVRVRVAPSPTGDPHVGTAYMSLFNLAFARQQGGKFILRIEDTDRARFREDSEQQIFDTLRWLGLDWDEGPDKGGPYAPYRQSERLDTYQPYVDKLLADGHAYRCWCTPERLAQMRAEQAKRKLATGYDRLCLGKTREERAALPGFSETPVVRMRIPADPPLVFDDVIRGRTKAPRPDDQVILKADGFPTYHLAVVVDDHEMGITHMVRGEEWISSTPKQILLYRWLGLPEPVYAHMPLLRNPDKQRSKISKRNNPAARLTWFAEEGYLPEALVNFLALVGYSMPDLREQFTFAELSESFSWDRVSEAGGVFDLKKLSWLNGEYIRSLPEAELTARIQDYLRSVGVLAADTPADKLDRLVQASPLVQTRMETLAEAVGMLSFLLVDADELEFTEDGLSSLKDDAPTVLAAALDALEQVPQWRHDALEAALRTAIVDGLGIKPRFAFGPLRVGVTGRRISPPLFESMEILGREESLARLRRLVARLG